jgi:ubiquinone/menaquinone biosynthesis C-methylase UbiE
VLGCYVPLHQLPSAERLAARSWPKPLDPTITLQVREPLAEAADTPSIPALTAIEDRTSQQVRQQYEENPYPRWLVPLPAPPTTVDAFLRDRFGIAGPKGGEILIAGCGTGEQSINSAQTFPQAKVLAVDISRTSLAYARRKTRELTIRNIEYAQADILKLGSLDRRFDMIESVGVLHHMADPEAGWRALLPLLRPGGVMRIALYSETGRRTLDAARALIVERNYGPTADDIRLWRRELTIRGHAPHSVDFFTVSSCRDLCFHVMEHRFTLPRIKHFLAANGLSFLGMEASGETLQQFAQEHREPGAQTDLDRWDAFERAHPSTFSNMYYLWLRGAPPAAA